MPFVVKAPIKLKSARTFEFANAKTMYGGRKIAVGDVIFVFDSENEGGSGLCARGVVTAVTPPAPKPKGARITPRVSIKVRRTATATRPFGRRELSGVTTWDDGRPETEIAFKFYRQATNKVGGISDQAARFLERYF